jgi:hypothetical protein
MAKRFADKPESWSALADVASELSYADWRNEILSFLFYAPEPRPVDPVVMPLRPAV